MLAINHLALLSSGFYLTLHLADLCVLLTVLLAFLKFLPATLCWLIIQGTIVLSTRQKVQSSHHQGLASPQTLHNHSPAQSSHVYKS